jgi:hypothetical protein
MEKSAVRVVVAPEVLLGLTLVPLEQLTKATQEVVARPTLPPIEVLVVVVVLAQSVKMEARQRTAEMAEMASHLL